MDAPKRLTQKGYRPRLIEERLDTLMRAFGCVEINGPKWCGKTWTALSRSASVSRLDEPAQRAAAEVDPSLALIGDAPHLVDEWQEVPEVWDAARRFVDASGNERGTLLLTGSTALKSEERSHVRHSGTGRIARLSMRPMALCESGDGEPLVSLASLFKGEDFAPQRRESTVDDVARWCCRGGWPANLGLLEDLARETASQYVHSVLDVNVLDEGMSPELAHGLLRALAMNESQAVTYKTLVKDASYGEAGPDERTIAAYLDLFNRLKLTEDLCGWEPPMRSKARVRVRPKRYFCDPSLAAALLGATPERLLVDNSVHYFRDEKGLEVDLIVEHDGRWGAIEVKLSDAKADDGARNLKALERKVLSNPAAQNAAPAFLAVVVGKGSIAYTRDDGVAVIPMAALGA